MLWILSLGVSSLDGTKHRWRGDDHHDGQQLWTSDSAATRDQLSHACILAFGVGWHLFENAIADLISNDSMNHLR